MEQTSTKRQETSAVCTGTAHSRLSAERLRELLHYNPETGRFTWLVSRPGMAAGSEAGTVATVRGYRQICVDLYRCYEHRLAFLYMTGSIPALVDHINGVAGDNRWSNLRASNKRLNAQNLKGARKDNKLGLLGVIASGGKFVAWIKPEGRRKCLGTFNTAEEAYAAYLAAKRELHDGNTL